MLQSTRTAFGGSPVGRLVAFVLLIGLGSAVAVAQDSDGILDLDIADLLEIEVTSVSKRPQAVNSAAAAVFVLTNEDLRAQGATTIADALRQVPGVHVGRIDANKWAVSVRGDNGRYNNKLLVLVDGRSVYTPTFSGVYWEIQDLMLEDVERIEIIRGPGSTMWGANAVNGVINIITKHAADTQGGLVTVRGGTPQQQSASMRWGTQFGDNAYARFYGKALGYGEFEDVAGQDAGDDWSSYRGGFRIDWQRDAEDALTLQGDAYGGSIHQTAAFPLLDAPYLTMFADEAEVSGGNLLGRLTHTFSPRSEMTFQAYYDRAVRDEFAARQVSNQFEYDLKHSYTTDRHSVVWGAGYHHTENQILQRSDVIRTNSTQALSVFSVFAQDEIRLWRDRLALTLGSKLEHNEITGLELQPSARLMWRAHDDHRLWSAVSRAVRTPMRAEDDLELLVRTIPPETPLNPGPLPVGLVTAGNEDLESEELIAYEAGYRFSRSNLSADVAVFYHDYKKLRDNGLGEVEVRYFDDPPHLVQPTVFNNEGESGDYGLEASVAWQTGHWLRWSLAYATIRNDEDATRTSEVYRVITDPEQLFSVNVKIEPSASFYLYGAFRYVDDCVALVGSDQAGYPVPAHEAIDLGVRWQLRTDLGLSVYAFNLAEDEHVEYAAETFTQPSVTPRTVYAKINWSF